MKQQSIGTGSLNNANIDEAKHQSILREACLYTLTGKPIQINLWNTFEKIVFYTQMLDSLIFLQIVKKVFYEIICDWFEGISVLVQILLGKHLRLNTNTSI